VDHHDKHAPWECEVQDRQLVPDFKGKKISWEASPPDNKAHNGMQTYLISYRVGYLEEQGVTMPRLLVGPSPLFQWKQRRKTLDALTLYFRSRSE
jgi:hypothetical protein